MKLGQKVKTSFGEVLVLDIKENYLILFSPEEGKFIKANSYQKNKQDKYYWEQGEYYNNLDDLITGLKN